MKELILGLVTGVLFGALLQQGRVLRFEKQVGAMLLKDMTILKFMLSAIIVGMIGIHLLVDMGLIKMSIKGTFVAANLVGGLLFGIGWAVAGYCPGTSVGAIGEGRWHAVWAVLGMLAGAAVYAEAYPLIKDSLLSWGDFGRITLASATGINHWVWIVVLSAVFIALFAWFEKKKL
ncbi:MAG TPA: YeeE/YedE family protein [Verrucomicrobia bacterium]|nr:YeeE/YedE family protein [Verrucomicrobiota bacterium]